jgi:uncharacterized membrane protein
MSRLWFAGTTTLWFFGAFLLQLALQLPPGLAVVESFGIGLLALFVVLAIENWPWRA